MKRELRTPRLIQCRVPLPSASRSTFFAKQAGLSSAFSVALLGSDSGHRRSWNQPQWLHRQAIQLLSSAPKGPEPPSGRCTWTADLQSRPERVRYGFYHEYLLYSYT